jgi:protocatechuate 3,4-dioxygenase beta subunit
MKGLTTRSRRYVIVVVALALFLLAAARLRSEASTATKAEAPAVPESQSSPGFARLTASAGAADARAVGECRGVLRGTVLDSEGEPVSGASVTLLPEGTEARSAANGAFSFGPVSCGVRVLHANTADAYGGPVQTHVSKEAPEVTVTLRRGLVLKVLVKSRKDRKPVVGADVTVVSGSQALGLESMLAVHRKTDGNGWAVFPAVSGEATTIQTRATGYARSINVLPLSAVRGYTRLTEVDLVAGSTLAGRVLDERGAGIAGACVHPSGTRMGLEWAPGCADPFDGVTDGEGAFELSLPEAGWAVTATSDGYTPTTSDVVNVTGPSEHYVQLVLKRGAGVDGVVLDDKGSAVPGASVTARLSPTSGVLQRGVADAKGEFHISGLPATSVTLRASTDEARSGYSAYDLSRTPRRSAIILTLTEAATISGYVYDSDGEPLPGAIVQCRIAEAVGEDIRGLDVEDVRSEVTDANGFFVFRGLEARPAPTGNDPGLRATYWLRALRPPYGNALGPPIPGKPVLAPAGSKSVALVFPAPGEIVGRVAMSDGTVPKMVSAQFGPGAAAIFQGPDGAFRLTGLGPGVEQLVIQASNGPAQRARQATLTVEVWSGQVNNVGIIEIPVVAPVDPPSDDAGISELPEAP